MQIKEWILREKWRIILTGIMIVAVPLLGLAAAVNFRVTAALEERVVKETGWFSAIAADHIDERLKSDIRLGSMFVTRPYLLSGLKRGDKAEMSRHLKILVENSPLLERAFIASPKGVLLADYPVDPKVHGRDFSDREWYKGVSKNWAPHVSEFYMRMAEPKRYLFAIAIPMRLEGEVKGILVMQPKADYMKDALSGIEIGRGHIYAVDGKGHLIYHSEQAIDEIMDFSGVPLVQKVLNGNEGVEKTIDPKHKDPVISAYHPVKEWGWGVVADKPVDVVLAPVRKINLLLFAVTGIMLLLGSFFAYRFSGMLISVQKLSNEISERSAELESANLELQAMNEEFQSMNEELQSQQKEISETNARLIEMSKAKSDFLANMSHELRTPLNSVIGFSEILEDGLYGSLNERQKEYIQDVLSSGRHLLQLINDILDLSKVESGRMELELSRFRMKDILGASSTMLKEKAMKHGIRLVCELEPEADIGIEADERKLKQIVFNLLSNAVKFTPEGGSVRVQARLAHGSQLMAHSKKEDGCELSAMSYQLSNTNSDYVEISVADTGIGIKPEDIPRLFKEFSQLENVYTKTKEGTGLGLALTKRLVELHGGSIWVESEFGRGSRFIFVIPVEQLQKPMAMPPETKPALKKEGKKTALIIDDDPVALSIIESALKAEGYDVDKASNGADGIEAAKTERPDLIVLDLMMPGMSGFEVLDSLRSDRGLAGVPVAILTSMDLLPEDRKRLMSKAEFLIEKGSLSREGFLSELKKTH